MANPTILDDKLHWYKDAIIYELHIKAFRDSDGDGIGDFGGLLEKLDYLVELGVTAIWVLPFYPSPLKDDGYDISDYFSINTSYGRISEFRKFLKEAHRRKLKVITELVINHTSDQHPWFQRARKSPKDSPERNYYVWSDDPGRYKDVRIIFQDFESSNWSWDEEAQQYYWHRFFHHQPDLNYDNPKVQEEVFKIIDYWCRMGVDGFRLDAVPYLFEREDTNGENLPETHVFLKKLRGHVDENYPGTLLLAEANMWPEDAVAYFGNGDECHMNYHFPLMPRMFMAIQMEDRHPVIDIFDQTPAIPEVCQWAMFLRNHDELTLEMVTDEERDYMYHTYAKDPKARINLGIRHRLAPLMENDRRRIELMNSLLFSMPGTPVIYYGDEIGMGDNFYLGDRDGVRTPMQWSPDRNAGFSDANPQLLYLPVILDPSYHYEAVNVEIQRSNTSSLFWHMKRIINIRKKHKAFGRGDIKFLDIENPKVLAFTRTYGNETILVVANLSKFSQPAEVDLGKFPGYVPEEIFSRNKFPPVKEGVPYFFTLGSYSVLWFVLKTEVNVPEEKTALPFLHLEKWKDLLDGNIRDNFENNIMPSYVVKTNWFAGKHRTIYNCSTRYHMIISTGGYEIFLLLLEIQYKSGSPEYYQIPLIFLQGKRSGSFLEQFPEAVLSEIDCGGQKGILCDAFYTKEMQQWLFEGMAMNQKIVAGKQRLEFKGGPSIKKYIKHHSPISSKIHKGADQNNTAISYDNSFFLKLYRKIDLGQHPDLQISRYLSEQAGFKHTPVYLGNADWKIKKWELTIAQMQAMVENHGDGHTYMLERLNNYIERILSLEKKDIYLGKLAGTLTEPAGFDTLPEDMKTLLGSRAAGQASLMGKRIAEMHLTLAAADSKEFAPEHFSLHYQRSLFSAIQSPIQDAFHILSKYKKKLPRHIYAEATCLEARKNELIDKLKRIYSRKIDVYKIRIHGNLNLRQVLLTGKDVAIHDFGGDPQRTLSERRLKRSALRDVASMIRSFYYTAYEGFFTNTYIPNEETQSLLPFARNWAHYMKGFFLKSYYEVIGKDGLIPGEKKDLVILMETFLLEKAFVALNYELTNRPDFVIVPLRIIESIPET